MAGPQHGGSWPPIAAIAYGVHACGLLVRRGICHVPGGAAKGCLSEEAGSCSAAAWENALWYIRRCEGIWRIGCAGIEDERYGAWQPGYGIDERAPRCARGRRRPFSMGSLLDCNQQQLRTALQSSISVRRCAPGELAQHLPRGGDPPESQRRPEPHGGNVLPGQWIVLVLVDGRRWHVGTVQMTTRYEVHHPTESVWTAARSSAQE
jgi:hypothetical protein